MPVKKAVIQVKIENTKPQQEVQPTIANIYGREQLKERVKQKTYKMKTLLVNTI